MRASPPFGIGGTNYHVIVASLPDALNAPPDTDSGRKAALLLAPPATARCGGWRRIIAGRCRECGCQLSGLRSPARARSISLPRGAIKP